MHFAPLLTEKPREELVGSGCLLVKEIETKGSQMGLMGL